MSSSEQEGNRFKGVRQTIALLMSVFVIGTAALTAYVLNLETELVESITINDAEYYSRALAEFRTLYTSEVVERVRGTGIKITHNYLDDDSAIPLPATFSMLLGQRLNADSDSKFRLFSNYPFPWRQETGGPRDQFEKDALLQLNQDSSKAFYRFEEGANGTRLRFATADLMRKSCVNCHNSHPQSPKVDWKTGDVRGVLSISLPVDADSARARRGLRGMLTLLVSSAVLGLALLAFVAVRLRRSAVDASRLAAQTQDVNLSLQNEIKQREIAEQERRSMVAQVRHTQKLETVGLLAGGIAHDLNNLLQGVLGNAAQAKQKMNEPEKAAEHIELVELIARRASMLMDQLLVYAGKTPVKKRPLNLSQLVENMKPLLSTAVSGRGSLSFDLGENLPEVEADSSQIEQMLMNLVTNAADAMSTRSKNINVRTGIAQLPADSLPGSVFKLELSPGSYAFIEVADVGVGMTQETVQRMFDPFFTTRRSGRGLGLATLQSSVVAHGGGVEVVSVIDKGTTIRIVLPSLELSKHKEQLSVPKKSVVGQVQTILVVDDDAPVRQVARLLLEKSGYKVLEASSGREGIELFQQNVDLVDVVLLDLSMPDMSGEETFHELRALRKDLRIVLSSGYMGDDASQRIIAHTRVSQLQKPYSRRELVAAVEESAMDDAT